MIFKPISPDSILVTPFTTHKQWEFNDTSSIQYYHGKFFNGTFSSAEISNIDKINNKYYEFAIHQSINSMLYRDYQDKPNELLDNITNKQERNLYENVHVYSIPQDIYGETLLKGSIEMTIGLPNTNNQLFVNNNFTLNNTIPSYSITDINNAIALTGSLSESLWIPVVDDGIYNLTPGLFTINNNTTTGSSLLIYNIPSASFSSGNHVLKFNINSINQTFPYNINIQNISLNEYINSQSLSINNIIDTHECIISLSNTNNNYIIFELSGSINISFSEISLYPIIDYNIVDDTYGNLINIDYYSSSYETKQSIDNIKIADWNFRNGYQKKNSYISNIYTRDFSKYKNHGLCNNIQFKDGIVSTLSDFNHNGYKTVDIITLLLQDQYGNIVEQDINMQLYSPDSYIRIPNNSDLNSFNFKRTDDFAISGLIKFNSYNLNNIILPNILLCGNTNSKASFEFAICGIAGTIKIESDNDFPIVVNFSDTPLYVYNRLSIPTICKITGDINEVISYTHNSGKLLSANFSESINLSSLSIKDGLIGSNLLVLPETNKLTSINLANNSHPYFNLTTFTFITSSAFDCNIDNCNLSLNDVESYLLKFNTYYTGSDNDGSNLFLRDNPNIGEYPYTINSENYWSDLTKNNNWTIKPPIN